MVKHYSAELRYKMNRSFKVKVGNRLVGYSGLVLSFGAERANVLISRALRSIKQVVSFLVKGVKVSFYCY